MILRDERKEQDDASRPAVLASALPCARHRSVCPTAYTPRPGTTKERRIEEQMPEFVRRGVRYFHTSMTPLMKFAARHFWSLVGEKRV